MSSHNHNQAPSTDSGTSYTTASTVSMPRARFAETENSIRTFYHNSLAAEVFNFSQFMQDHLRKSQNKSTGSMLSSIAKETLARMSLNQQHSSSSACSNNNNENDDDSDNDNDNKPNSASSTSSPSRFTRYSETIIHALTMIFNSMNKEPTNHGTNFHLDLNPEDFTQILSICLRTVFLLIVVNGTVSEDFSSPNEASSSSLSMSVSATKKKKSSSSSTKNFWFSIPNRRKRRTAKITQFKAIVDISRKLQKMSKDAESEWERDFSYNNNESRVKAVIDILAQFSFDRSRQSGNNLTSSSSAKREEGEDAAVGFELSDEEKEKIEKNRKLLQRGLKAVTYIEALASASPKNFWNTADDESDNSDDQEDNNNNNNHNNTEQQQQPQQKRHHKQERRSRPNENDDDDDDYNINNVNKQKGCTKTNKNSSPSESSSTFVDAYETKWNHHFRHGCGLLGGMSQFVKGLLEQMQFEVNRANDEFDLVPAPTPALMHPEGWTSRFDPVEGKFWVKKQNNTNNNICFPTFWFQICHELKKLGIHERLIRSVKWEEETEMMNQAVSTADEQKPSAVLAPPPPENNDEAAIAKQNNFKKPEEEKKNTDETNHNNNHKNPWVHFVGESSNTNNKLATAVDEINPLLKKSDGTSKPLPETKTLHSKDDLQNNRPPATLPTVLSRLVNDRSHSHNEVHTSYEKIINLMNQLREEVSHFSSCAEVSNTLDAVTPQFIESTKMDIANLKVLSDILFASSAIAASTPGFFFGLNSKQWEKEMVDLMLK